MAIREFRGVEEAIKSICDDQELSDEVHDRIQSRRLVSALTALRALNGLTQDDVARAIGTTQERISKLERGDDAALLFSEIEAYAKLLDYDVTISLTARSKSQATGPTVISVR